MKLLCCRGKTRGPFGIPAAVALALVLAACHQDPIFDIISREVKPQEPRIKGVPTKMALFNRALPPAEDWGLYVGGYSLHRYAQAANGSGIAVWDEGEIPQPPDRIFDLAATRNALYALTGMETLKLYRLAQGSAAWEEVGFESGDQGFPRFQAIYGVTNEEGSPEGDRLFVGTSNNSPAESGSADYAIFYTDGGALQPLQTGTALITGAASDGSIYYISTNGGSTYVMDGAGITVITSDRIAGMIKIDSGILALCDNGDILHAAGGSLNKLNSKDTSFRFRGAAAVWKGENGERLLLAAVRNSDPVYGYREVLLDQGPLSNFTAGEIRLRHPGSEAPTTVGDDKQFKDTIEPKPVNAILQTPRSIDPAGTLFVSIQGTGTMQNDIDGGLWSYRARDGIWQWNAEN
jgi:hypothetical protein